MILKNISLYPFGLFKMELSQLIHVFISEQLVEFPNFIKNSVKSPSMLKSIDRGKIKFLDVCGIAFFEVEEVWNNEGYDKELNAFKKIQNDSYSE